MRLNGLLISAALKESSEVRAKGLEQLVSVLRLCQGWENCQENQIRFETVGGGMSNFLFRCENRQTGEEALVRVYGTGTEAILDRKKEVEIFRKMSEYGGPKLLGEFENGRIEEFIPSDPLSPQEFRQSEYSKRIAQQVAQLHKVCQTNNRNHIWERIEEMKTMATQDFSKFDCNEKLNEILSHVDELIEKLKRNIPEKVSNDVVFAHGDLQHGNILKRKDSNALVLIDFEYSLEVPRAFDIANHFCEWAADYLSDAPHVMNYERFPGIDDQRMFIESYLREFKDEVTESEIEELLHAVNVMIPVSHLFWGLWAVVQFQTSPSSSDFNYQSYALQRLQQIKL